MLRKEDFTLVGKVERLMDFEKKHLLSMIHFTFCVVVESQLKRDSFLSDAYKSEFYGIQSTLNWLGIIVHYQGEKKSPHKVYEEILAELEELAKEREVS